MSKIEFLENIDEKILHKLLKKFDAKDYDLSSFYDKSGNVIECLLRTDDFFKSIDYLTISTYSEEMVSTSKYLKDEIQDYINKKKEISILSIPMSEEKRITELLNSEVIKKFNIEFTDDFKMEFESSITSLYQKADDIQFHEIEKELISCVKNCNNISNLKFLVYSEDFKLKDVNLLLDNQVHVKIENITEAIVDEMDCAGIDLKDIKNTHGDYYNVKVTKTDYTKWHRHLKEINELRNNFSEENEVFNKKNIGIEVGR